MPDDLSALMDEFEENLEVHFKTENIGGSFEATNTGQNIGIMGFSSADELADACECTEASCPTRRYALPHELPVAYVWLRPRRWQRFVAALFWPAVPLVKLARRLRGR